MTVTLAGPFFRLTFEIAQLPIPLLFVCDVVHVCEPKLILITRPEMATFDVDFKLAESVTALPLLMEVGPV